MPTLNFEDPQPQRSQLGKPLRLILGVGVLITVLALGSTLAANINLNESQPVEFGQGVVQTTACDQDGIGLQPQSHLFESDAGSEFKLTGILFSDISTQCYGKIFRIKAYGSKSSDPIEFHTGRSKIEFKYLRDGTLISDEFMITQSQESLQVTFNVPFTLAKDVYNFTIESVNPVALNAGLLDTSFGNDGVRIIDFGRIELTQKVLIDSSGRILVVSISFNDLEHEFIISRFSSQGVVDSTYGADGDFIFTSNSPIEIGGAVLDRQGDVLIAGHEGDNAAIWKITSEGELDTRFGDLGKQLVQIPDSNRAYFNAAQFDENEHIVVTGHSCNDPERTCDPFVARLTGNGTLDTSFGVGGITIIEFNKPAFSYTVRIDAYGRIYIAGERMGVSSGDIFVVRLLSNGAPDDAFGNAGKLVFDFSPLFESAMGIAINPLGGLYVAGVTQVAAKDVILLMALKSDGSIDTGFGNAGLSELIPDIGGQAWVTGITIGIDGQIYVAGRSTINEISTALVARVLPTGFLDTSFGDSGYSRFSTLNSEDSFAFNAVFQETGKILVFGRTRILNGQNDGFVLQLE